MSFRKRRIDLTFQLGLGAFGEDGADTVKVSGLRVQASISQTSGPGLGMLNMRVYGLTPSLLRKLSALNRGDTLNQKNKVTVEAGDDTIGMANVFEGQIIVGQMMLNEAPASPLLVQGAAGALEAVKTGPPVSYPGHADAADILADLAAKMGVEFENNGVSAQLATPVYYGSLREQVKRCAVDAGIEWILDGKKLAIWKRDGARHGTATVVSVKSGMVGYPAYSSGLNGLALTTEFNPDIRIGGLVRVQSRLDIANGFWRAFEIGHELESESPGGQWFTRFNASPYVQ